MSESEVQTLRTELQGLEKRLTERFDNVEKDLDEVKKRLKAIEKEIHSYGNGKLGISIRPDRLENLRKLLAWAIPLLTALLIVFVGYYITLLEK